MRLQHYEFHLLIFDSHLIVPLPFMIVQICSDDYVKMIQNKISYQVRIITTKDTTKRHRLLSCQSIFISHCEGNTCVRVGNEVFSVNSDTFAGSVGGRM